jgi:uncharacterized membrane protein YdbT with pleckstrin-like domain
MGVTDTEQLLLEVRPSWWRFFWYFFFFWLIIPLIAAIWQKHSFIMRVYVDKVSVETGILSKSYTDIFIKNIRTINVTQGPFQRICHIGDIMIATAGTQWYEIIARGLPEPMYIKNVLIKQGKMPTQ